MFCYKDFSKQLQATVGSKCNKNNLIILLSMKKGSNLS